MRHSSESGHGNNPSKVFPSSQGICLRKDNLNDNFLIIEPTWRGAAIFAFLLSRVEWPILSPWCLFVWLVCCPWAVTKKFQYSKIPQPKCVSGYSEQPPPNLVLCRFGLTLIWTPCHAASLKIPPYHLTLRLHIVLSHYLSLNVYLILFIYLPKEKLQLN